MMFTRLTFIKTGSSLLCRVADKGVMPMMLRSKYQKILSGIVPAGAVGASLLLGSAVAGRASEEPPSLQPQALQPTGVAERLAAVRQAVSDVANGESARRADPDMMRLAWGNWWRNGGWGWRRPYWGWGWPNWNNWHNWHNWPNYWRNW
jgi:hypothetical protein